MKRYLFAIDFLFVVFSHSVFAFQEFPSYFDVNGWYLGVSGSTVSCPDGSPNKWVLYVNGVETYTADPFFCVSPPWYPDFTASRTGLSAGGTYRYVFYHNGEALGYIMARYIDDSHSEVISDETYTRIISVTPYNGETVATSTTGTLGSTGFIATSTASADIYIQQSFYNKTQAQGAVAPIVVTSTFKHVKGDEGYFDFSDTADMRWNGVYSVTTSIKRDRFLWIDDTIYSTTTSFIAGQKTGYDLTLENPILTLTGSASTTAQWMSSCAISWTEGFDLGMCVSTLVGAILVPSNADMTMFIQNAKDQVLTKAPIGYVTRFVSIVGGNATTTLPVLSVTQKAGTPLAGTYSFDPSYYLSKANHIVRDVLTTDTSLVEGEEGQNVWDIIMPYLTKLMYLLLFLKIIIELMDIREEQKGSNLFGKGQKKTGVTNDEYAYKEWLYKHKK